MRTAAILLLLSAPLLVAQPAAGPGDEKTWQSFIEWLKSPAAPDNPPEIMQAYMQRLLAGGATEEQAKAQLGVIGRMAGRPGSEFTPTVFDKLYSSAAPPFRTEPSAFLCRAVSGLKPGKALDAAMGQGRNALFLAGQGWNVTGYDVSPQGLAVANRNAAAAGVKLTTVLQSHEAFPFGEAQWDLVTLVFANVSMEDAKFLERVKKSLKPGGMIVVEQFNAAPVEGAIGPANALFQTFRDFRVVLYEDVADVSDWGKMKARIGRIAAVRD